MKIEKAFVKYIDLYQGWPSFLRGRVQIVQKFQRNFSYTHGNFVDQNKVMEPSKISINFFIMIINAYCSYIV